MSSLGQWLRPSRSVPQVSWAAGESNWKAKPKTIVMLMLGLWLFGTGEAALIAANIGVSPWTVLAQGISLKLGLTIGWATFLISTVVLVLWIPLKSRPGLGTVSNIVVIAVAIEVMTAVFPEPKTRLLAVIQVLVGVGIVGLGSGFYITSNVGPGPRDGLMTGIHRVFGIRIGRARLAIESSVLIFGWLLGGTVGIGTIVFGLCIGQAVALSFGVVARLDKSLGNF